ARQSGGAGGGDRPLRRQPDRIARGACARGLPQARRSELAQAHRGLEGPGLERQVRIPPGASQHAHERSAKLSAGRTHPLGVADAGNYRSTTTTTENRDMSEFTLPANSKVGQGKHWPTPKEDARAKTFRIYRWDPDENANPTMDAFEID